MKLTPKKIEECAQWVRENGLTDCGGASIKKFCEYTHINKQTYYNWLKDANFANAIEKAKEEFTETLERDLVVSLAKAAKGYTFVKKKTEYENSIEIIDGKQINKPKIKKQTTEDVNVPPNVGAAIFLLTNIAPERWKNKVSNDINADVKANVDETKKYDVSDIPDDLMFAVADKLQEAQYNRIQEAKK